MAPITIVVDGHAYEAPLNSWYGYNIFPSNINFCLFIYRWTPKHHLYRFYQLKIFILREHPSGFKGPEAVDCSVQCDSLAASMLL